jgi:hypothetical protein
VCSYPILLESRDGGRHIDVYEGSLRAVSAAAGLSL